MRTILLVLASATAGLLLIALGVVFFVFPRVSPAPDLHVEATPALVARGDYLFNEGLSCTGCHTPELTPHRLSGVPDLARTAAGRDMGGPDKGFPTEIYAPNLTPTALGTWSDGQIYRAITSGVDKDGHPLFALMPYVFYSHLDPNDVKALIAYLRSLPPQPVTLPKLKLPMPLPIIMRFVAADAQPEQRPAESDAVNLGRYLTHTGACFECHTKRNARGENTGVPFAGGNVFALAAGGVSVSANITPDKVTGIGNWTREDFIAHFRARNRSAMEKIKPAAGEFDTEMPWTAFAGMSDGDLSAIYAYLRTVPPASSQVATYLPPDGK